MKWILITDDPIVILGRMRRLICIPFSSTPQRALRLILSRQSAAPSGRVWKEHIIQELQFCTIHTRAISHTYVIYACRWGGKDEDRILASGHRVHLLKNSGHWVRDAGQIDGWLEKACNALAMYAWIQVHTERPMELFDIMSPSFGAVDLHQRRTMAPRWPNGDLESSISVI